jgi:hypothetical protein
MAHIIDIKHDIFSPDVVLQALYGEISRDEINELIRKSCA